MRTFGLSDGTFDSNMIYLMIIVLTLSFGFKVGVLTSDNCEYGAMGGEGIRLLWRLLNLRQGWWWWVGLVFDLVSVGVAQCRVCDLWNCWRVGYFWN
jgi:hypothetical protein